MRGSNLAEKSNVLEGQFIPSALRLVESTNPLDEIISRKTVRQHIYEFALVLACFFNLVSCWLIWRREMVGPALTLTAGTLAFAWCGKHKPHLLRPVWKGWMMIGAVLGTVVTTVLLSAMWLGMFVPLAIVLKVFGKAVMDTSFRQPVPSYFRDRKEEDNDFKLLQRQY